MKKEQSYVIILYFSYVIILLYYNISYVIIL